MYYPFKNKINFYTAHIYDMAEKHKMNLDRVINFMREHHNSISNDPSFGAKKIRLVRAHSS